MDRRELLVGGVLAATAAALRENLAAACGGLPDRRQRTQIAEAVAAI